MKNEEEIKSIINGIEQQLNETFPPGDERRWEKFYIKNQIEKKDNKSINSLSDHIRAMVYAFLSSQAEWSKISGCLKDIDSLFCRYDPETLLKMKPSELAEGIKGLKCGNMSINKQMEALIDNIETLKKIKSEYGSVDAFYETKINHDSKDEHPYIALIKTLSYANNDYKLKQMGVALVSEYLRNLGHDISKPDRHIKRILSSEILGEISNKYNEKLTFEAFKVIRCYSKITGKREAYIDYLLWSFCAEGYGEICTKRYDKCSMCKINKYCEKFKKRAS